MVPLLRENYVGLALQPALSTIPTSIFGTPLIAPLPIMSICQGYSDENPPLNVSSLAGVRHLYLPL